MRLKKKGKRKCCFNSKLIIMLGVYFHFMQQPEKNTERFTFAQ